MHGCNSGSALLVNAEVDFMGRVVDGGVGIGVKTSPRRSAIEQAQAELRQEYDVREERRRELDFLEKGGNPLDFKYSNAASVSVQSTSLTDQHAQHFVTSEAKGSFAQSASAHGDSVESSGRPGVPAACEPNSADNLLLFDGENELPEGERKSMHSRKRNTVVPSEQSSHMEGTQNVKESEDSTIFRPYARRYRSKIKRDGGRSSSTDIVHGRGGHGSSLLARGASKDVKASTSEPNNQKEKNISSVTTTKSATSNGDLASKVITSDDKLNMELDGGKPVEETTSHSKGDQFERKADVIASKTMIDDLPKEPTIIEAHKSPVSLAFEEPNLVVGKEQVVSASLERLPGTGATKPENETSSHQLNGVADAKIDRKNISNEEQNSCVAIGTKGLDMESSSTKNSLSLDVNNDNEACINPKNVDSNVNPLEYTSEKEESPALAVGESAKEKNEIKVLDNAAVICDANTSLNQNHSLNDSTVKVEEVRSELQIEVSCPSNNEVIQSSDAVSEADRKVSTVQGDNSNSNIDKTCASRPQGTMDNFMCEIPEMTFSGITCTDNADTQTSLENHVEMVDKAREDSILEEARIIEAKRKRIAELSVGTLPLENSWKSHWDFVLEEMAWLANDFAQERLWKMTAAAQICKRVAFTSRFKFEEQIRYWKLKKIALTLANAVMDFWHSAEILLTSKDANLGPKTCGHDLMGSRTNKVTEITISELDMDAKECQRHTGKNNGFAIRAYALRYLKYNSSPVPSLLAEAPATPDRISDLGIMDISWDEHLTEENLFYAVHSGAMETYRRSIESYMVQTEKTGSTVQEEVETSAYDARAEFGYDDSVYDEDEGETSTYYLPGAFEGRQSSKLNQKKRKNPMKSYPARQYKVDADLPYKNCGQPSIFMGKRPSSSLNDGSVPAKRVRTGSRQRVLSPFSSAAAARDSQAPTQTDASSGDTNSFQDEQNTLHGGLRTQNSMEVDSIGDFERQQPYDCAGTPAKPKKKKKAKNLGSAYNQGWQLESPVHSEQRDYLKKRPESHHFDSNGTSGLYGQHNAKKLKIMKHQPDSAYDITPNGSIPSPVGSQMSNMPNPSKIIRLIHGSDKGRKAKTPKMSTGQPASGSPWSLFEDQVNFWYLFLKLFFNCCYRYNHALRCFWIYVQALVVLVHDMGPNWQLVSDAINSTLQFKCIFRKPNECKERHKILMDRSGDGADSADDSGSSQPYPSTLPGIPKGSARQLFQRLQGPMEEDTLKSHFEKIILISKKQNYWRSQDLKQIVPVHNSHVIALSQVCPNNLNGGVLTPLDLCDATASSQDVLPFGSQASHVSGLAMLNQGDVGSRLPASGGNSSLQGSSSMVLGNNLSSPSAPLNAAVRDCRYGVPRTSLPADEQHRIQQYNQMLSGRNVQQSNLSLAGSVSGSECGRMLPAANGMGMMCGVNRSMPMSRPGFQGMASSAMLNSGSMLSSNMGGMPSPVNMPPGPGSGQANSMLRPHDTTQLMRSGPNPEQQMQVAPELQMQAQRNGQGIPAFNGLSSAYPNHPQQQQTPPQQSCALSKSRHANLQGSNHATGSQQQVSAMRLAKERQMQPQQLHMHQQQQQPRQPFAASSTLMPQVQPQAQLPISSLQNSSQIQSQASNQPVSLPLTPTSPMPPTSIQRQQKHQLSPHGLGRNPQPGASGLNNQVGKQRQQQSVQQQFQQSSRHHPQQHQQMQSQQQSKLLKGGGRGLINQNVSADHARLNGVSMAPGNQGAKKGEHMIQSQGLYSGPGVSPVQPSKPVVSSQPLNHSQPQQKVMSGAAALSTKQLQQMASHSDNSSQGQVSTVPSGRTLSAVHQSVLPGAMGSHHQHWQLQSQLHQKHANQNHPSIQKMLQQNRQTNSDPSSKSQAEPAQADQQPRNNASQMGTTTTSAMHQAGHDLVNNMVPVVSPSVGGSQWKSPEAVYDPGMPNVATQVGSIGSAPLTTSAGSDPGPSVSQGLGQRQLSGSLPHLGNNSGAQWSHQPQIQQSSTPPSSQQHYQPPEQLQQDQHNSPPQQLPLQQQPQQQTMHLQAAQGSLYHRHSNSKLE
ncbi:chromatin modification-related protein EAF1 B-like isoform X1 [Gossypium arboreum]|uniref:chromatin modification-related protein EAF1 B-like isoform X1 n=1 Tax=Gossypium arboreum TaxID=29729 RepID=UPI0022F16465|nr:chromatin modification-related protein EAF1 B-like isoform X1 [Gossypium arboreum]XP_052887546.1 chromatin modification-related protein EAF1 B-like isoform X1 [Gossypium arboreum]XP_052887547.1 chromatin modification-related protein EAF1 B-like isoform X1 [Gossypium arboreum]